MGQMLVWVLQAFSAWIHICAIRLFVESILRYGLPPKFLAVLLKPNQKNTTKLRKLLASLFGSSGAPLSYACSQFYLALVLWLPCYHIRSTLWLALIQLKVLSILSGTSQYFDGEAGATGGLAGESEMFPYVSFTVSVDG